MLLVQKLKLPNGKTISLKLEANTSYVLKGKNGSGKSLLLKALANLYPLQFESFSYNDKTIKDWTPEIYRSQVLYIPSVNFYAHDGTVEDFLNLPFSLNVHKDCKPIVSFNDYLSKWNLTGRKFSELSSGEKQSLSFLRGLSLNPEILLLDEPFSHLALERTQELEQLLTQWKTEHQKSFLIVSHDPHQQERLKLTPIEFDQISI